MRSTPRVESDVSSTEVLSLLGDEYAREVLLAVADRPRSGAEVARATSVSEPTAFRRLNRLAAADLVEVVPSIDVENGNHCRRYRAAFERVTVRLTDDGELRVAVDDEAGGR